MVFYGVQTGGSVNYGEITLTDELWKGVPRETTPHDEGKGLPVPFVVSRTPGEGTFFRIPTGLEYTPADYFSETGANGDWWIVSTSTCVKSGGGTPSDGDTVERVYGQEGVMDLIIGSWSGGGDGPIYREGGGRPYLEFVGSSGTGDSLITDTAIDFPEYVLQFAGTITGNVRSYTVLSHGWTVDSDGNGFSTSKTTQKTSYYLNGSEVSNGFSSPTSPEYDSADNWGDYMDEPHVWQIRQGSSVSDDDRGVSADRWKPRGVYARGAADDINAVVTSSTGCSFFSRRCSGAFYGALLGDDPEIDFRLQHYWRTRMGPDSYMQI